MLKPALDRLQQGVLLLADGEFDDAFRQQVAADERPAFVAGGLVVDADGAGLDMPPGFAVRGGEAGGDEGGEQAEACCKVGVGDFGGRQGQVEGTGFERRGVFERDV